MPVSWDSNPRTQTTPLKKKNIAKVATFSLRSLKKTSYPYACHCNFSNFTLGKMLLPTQQVPHCSTCLCLDPEKIRVTPSSPLF